LSKEIKSNVARIETANKTLYNLGAAGLHGIHDHFSSRINHSVFIGKEI
jgi:hypothetical protein